MTQFHEKSNWINWLLTQASPLDFASIVFVNMRSITSLEIKKFYLKLRSLSFNFAWVFNRFVILNYPLINGKNEYFFNKNLTKLAGCSRYVEGTFYFCELEKMMRFLETFFSFSAVEKAILQMLVFESSYFDEVSVTQKKKRILVRYDQFLSLIRYSVLSPEGT